ncbi:hypothetical protein HYU11_05845 [Candidatus Woesearchaeota archaeon]|nr:hypothetical protein [Candidatus Woesearchaeota archaeon]
MGKKSIITEPMTVTQVLHATPGANYEIGGLPVHLETIYPEFKKEPLKVVSYSCVLEGILQHTGQTVRTGKVNYYCIHGGGSLHETVSKELAGYPKTGDVIPVRHNGLKPSIDGIVYVHVHYRVTPQFQEGTLQFTLPIF